MEQRVYFPYSVTVKLLRGDVRNKQQAFEEQSHFDALLLDDLKRQFPEASPFLLGAEAYVGSYGESGWISLILNPTTIADTYAFIVSAAWVSGLFERVLNRRHGRNIRSAIIRTGPPVFNAPSSDRITIEAHVTRTTELGVNSATDTFTRLNENRPGLMLFLAAAAMIGIVVFNHFDNQQKASEFAKLNSRIAGLEESLRNIPKPPPRQLT